MSTARERPLTRRAWGARRRCPAAAPRARPRAKSGSHGWRRAPAVCMAGSEWEGCLLAIDRSFGRRSWQRRIGRRSGMPVASRPLGAHHRRPLGQQRLEDGLQQPGGRALPGRGPSACSRLAGARAAPHAAAASLPCVPSAQTRAGPRGAAGPREAVRCGSPSGLPRNQAGVQGHGMHWQERQGRRSLEAAGAPVCTAQHEFPVQERPGCPALPHPQCTPHWAGIDLASPQAPQQRPRRKKHWRHAPSPPRTPLPCAECRAAVAAVAAWM